MILETGDLFLRFFVVNKRENSFKITINATNKIPKDPSTDTSGRIILSPEGLAVHVDTQFNAPIPRLECAFRK